MNSREYRELQEAYFGVYEELSDLDEVWGTGKVDPNYGTHNRGNERTGQQAGGRAMTKTPAEKMGDKLAKLKGLADLRKPLGSQHTPKTQTRIRKLTTATKRSSDELAGQHVQRIDMRTKERERADQLAADARERGRAEGRKESQNESYDLYDVILSHLLDEGYADTLEAAEGIMVSMSEEWKQSIMERDAEPGEEDDSPDVRAHNRSLKDKAGKKLYPSGRAGNARRPDPSKDPRYGSQY